MRMWMVSPKYLCNKHLLGEHGELHKFLPSWKKQHSITGRILTNAMEPLSYKARHDALAEEMISRGMNHKSPLEQPDFSYLPPEELNYKVDTIRSSTLLIYRCTECMKRLAK